MVFFLFSVAIACSTSQAVEETSTSNINATVGTTAENRQGSADSASTSNIQATRGPIAEHKQGSAECITGINGLNVACGGQAAECITGINGLNVACGGQAAECITGINGLNVACGGQAAECITGINGLNVACGGDPQLNPNRKGPSFTLRGNTDQSHLAYVSFTVVSVGDAPFFRQAA